MNATADLALSHWPVAVQSCELAAHRENAVYRVTAVDGSEYALRLHRPGYRSPQELQSELLWMAELARQGLRVPEPLTTKTGSHIVLVDGIHVDLLTWLPGDPLGKSGTPLVLPDAPATFFQIGRETARLHQLSDKWQKPHGFVRHAWDHNGLIGANPVWGPFWENPGLTKNDLKIMAAARTKANAELAQLAGTLDYGLIHADLLRENILLEGECVHLIDFDDGGHGFRLFELATTLLRNRSEPEYAELQQQLITGYQSVRPLDTSRLPMFMALRAFTYVGWIIPRMHEPGKQSRNARIIAEAVELANIYLES